MNRCPAHASPHYFTNMSCRTANLPFARSSIARAVITALALGAFRIAGAQGSPPLLLGDVVSHEAGTPLAHAMVTVLGLDRQTFTSDRGVFAFTSLEPGRYRIRAVHIGYSPLEVNVDVPAGAEPPRVRIELTHLSVQLATVKVTAAVRCTAPGRPNPDIEPDFAAIVAQLRMNAEQYKLLSDSFPFRYKVEQVYYSVKGDSSRGDPKIETEAYRSDVHGWEYKMGDVVERMRDGRTMMHLPTLRDFASYEFLNNHCFRYAGLDSTRDGVFIHIAFQADVQIRNPDVNGSVYLDAKTYQIRRAELELTKIPAGLSQVSAVHVTTVFGEVAPSVDVIQVVHGVTSLRHWGWGATVAMTEDQRTYDFEWLGNNPAHPAIQP
jgi:hypothetical protein